MSQKAGKALARTSLSVRISYELKECIRIASFDLRVKENSLVEDILVQWMHHHLDPDDLALQRMGLKLPPEIPVVARPRGYLESISFTGNRQRSVVPRDSDEADFLEDAIREMGIQDDFDEDYDALDHLDPDEGEGLDDEILGAETEVKPEVVTPQPKQPSPPSSKDVLHTMYNIPIASEGFERDPGFDPINLPKAWNAVAQESNG